VDHVVVTKRGRPALVLMSHDDFLGWQETIEIMSDPGAMRAIAAGERDIKAGRVTPAHVVLRRLRV
jgi:PHD/YefM family antitoxin component YafN of YafNO toxin-antitoxin module